MGPADTASTSERSSDDPSAPVERRRRGLRPRLLVAVAGVALLLWGIAALILLGTGRGHLVRAEQTLSDSRSAIEDLDLEAASVAVSSANADLASASGALTSPVLAPVLAVPIVGDDLRAVRALATNGAAVTDAADAAVEFLAGLPDGLGGLAPDDGRFPVEHYEELAPIVARIAEAATTAVEEIEASPASGRFEQVVDARERVLELLGPIAEQADAAALLAVELPRFLGSDGPRDYLFGAATPAELRGTGGFIGSVALLQVDQGALEFGTFEASSDLPDLPPGELPPPVREDAERWSRYGGTGLFVNLNRTADFPSAAQAMLAHWEATRGMRLDGMVVVDPFAFEALLDLSGPTEVPAYEVTLDAGSVVAFVANEAYGAFEDATERKEVLGEVAAATFGRFLAGDVGVEPQAAVARFAELVEDGHLVAYAADPSTQSALVSAGVAGGLGARDGMLQGDLVNVVLNSGTASKVDFFAERTVEIETTLLADGSARSILEVTIENQAPTTDQVKYVIGPNNPVLEAGDNLQDVSVYLAPQAEFTEVPPPADGPTFTETALGHPVHDGWVRIPSGESVERRYAWRTSDAWSVTEENLIAYDLLFQGQTVIRPTELIIRVGIPSGMDIVDPPLGVRVEGEIIIWEGEVRGENVVLPLRFARPSPPDS
jgi:hypothetical protein